MIISFLSNFELRGLIQSAAIYIFTSFEQRNALERLPWAQTLLPFKPEQVYNPSTPVSSALRHTMHRRSSRNSATTHPDPSLLNQGYTFFPPGSNSYTANMRDVTFGPNASIISGSWGSYVRMDASPIGSMANMDGSDRVNHDRREFFF